MKVQVEGIIHNWADEIPNIIVRVINAISIARTRRSCRQHSFKSPKKRNLTSSLSMVTERTIFGSLTVGYRMVNRWNIDY